MEAALLFSVDPTVLYLDLYYYKMMSYYYRTMPLLKDDAISVIMYILSLQDINHDQELRLRVQQSKNQILPPFPRVSLVAQMVKNLPAMQETRVQSLGQDDPLEKGWKPTLVFLPGEFHGQRSLGDYSP